MLDWVINLKNWITSYIPYIYYLACHRQHQLRTKINDRLPWNVWIVKHVWDCAHIGFNIGCKRIVRPLRRWDILACLRCGGRDLWRCFLRRSGLCMRPKRICIAIKINLVRNCCRETRGGNPRCLSIQLIAYLAYSLLINPHLSSITYSLSS